MKEKISKDASLISKHYTGEYLNKLSGLWKLGWMINSLIFISEDCIARVREKQ